MSFTQKINFSWCKGCGLCVSLCPKGVFEIEKGVVKAVHPERCTGCRLCEKHCPDFAIKIKPLKHQINKKNG